MSSARAAGPLEAVLAVALGLNLWATLCWGPLTLEWAEPDTRWAVVALELLPLALLGLGQAVGRGWASLGAFPASLIPAFLALPQADQDALGSPLGFFSLGASLALYLGVAARRAAWRVAGPRLAVEATPARPLARKADLWWPYRAHFAPRWGLLLGLLGLGVWGLNFKEGVAERYLVRFEAQAAQAQVLGNLIFLFVWAVAAYLFFFAPGLNLELEQRALDARLGELAEGTTPKRQGLRVLGSLGGVAVVGAAWWWWSRGG